MACSHNTNQHAWDWVLTVLLAVHDCCNLQLISMLLEAICNYCTILAVLLPLLLLLCWCCYCCCLLAVYTTVKEYAMFAIHSVMMHNSLLCPCNSTYYPTSLDDLDKLDDLLDIAGPADLLQPWLFPKH